MLEELLFRVLFLSIYAVFGGFRIYYRRKSEKAMPSTNKDKEKKNKIGGWAGIILAIGILGMLISVIVYLVIPPWIPWFPLPFPSFLRWIGIFLGASTIPFLIWIHRTLGHYYSAILQIKNEHALITIGPYARIRHPMYTIFILFTFSFIIVTANLFVTIFGLIVIFMFFPVSKKEEQMMINQFGDEYRTYMNQTGRFFPRIRKYKRDSNQVTQKEG